MMRLRRQAPVRRLHSIQLVLFSDLPGRWIANYRGRKYSPGHHARYELECQHHLAEHENWCADVSCFLNNAERSSYSLRRGLALAPQAGCLARVRDGCKCGHILWSSRFGTGRNRLFLRHGKHLRRYGALIKINVQRKFSRCQGTTSIFKKTHQALEAWKRASALTSFGASLALSVKKTELGMFCYFLMLPSASNCLR